MREHPYRVNACRLSEGTGTSTKSSAVSRLSHHPPSARGASRLSRQAVLALGPPLAGQHRWRGSLDETSWLEYEGLTGLSGLSEAPEPDSDGWMCIDST